MDRTTLVPVPVTCPCPGTPHADGDTVYLFPKLGLQGGVLAERQIRDMAGERTPNEILAVLTETFVLHGIADWTLVDADAKPVEVTEQAKRAIVLSDWGFARMIADKADSLYTAAVLDPLLTRSSNGSRQPSTAASTRPPKRSASKRQKPPQSSSTATSQTGATTTTSV